MAADYDLVILGGSPTGREAATLASQRGARVALILESGIEHRAPVADATESLRWFYTEVSRSGSFRQSPADQAWSALQPKAAMAAENSAIHTPRQLMAAGVDVICGQPVLVSSHRVCVQDRCLKARKLLLALEGEWLPPVLPGLADIAYVTPASLAKLKTLPQSLVILGSSPMALEIAQALARSGVTLTVLTPSLQLLPSEEPMVSQWIAAELRAAGVKVHLGVQPTQVMATNTGICVQAESARWTADRLLIGTSPRPQLMGLNLAALGLKLKDHALWVNQYLQTRHPHVYACGEVLGGYGLPVIARHEAAVAVNNALFWNHRQVSYGHLPHTLLTEPEFCRVGMTVAQAQQRYGLKAIVVCDEVLDGNPKAQALGNTTGFCRLVTHRRGQLLGGHMVGLGASEWGQVMAIALKHRLTLQDLAQLPTLPESLTDMVRKTAEQWACERWQPGQWRRDWAENWFNWRRSR